MITTVKVEEGSIAELATLFDNTNRELVSSHSDWLGAWFTANHEASEVTVIARWSNAESYELLRSSEEFQAIMGQFSSRFAGPPTVSVNEEM